MKIIIANGPPGTGKDTFADYVVSIFPGAVKARFKDVLYRYSYENWRIERRDMSYDEWIALCNDPVAKEIPVEWLGSIKVPMRSPRQALIYVSEKVLKAQYGQDAVALRTVAVLKHMYPDWANMVFVFSDGGFNNEVNLLLTEFGISRKDMYIYRIDKKGCSFAGDSREYIHDFNTQIYNNGAMSTFLAEIRNIFRFITLTDLTWPLPMITKQGTPHA